MRSILIVTVLFLLCQVQSRADVPAPLINPIAGDSQLALPGNANVDQILDGLNARGRALDDFTAKVSMETGDPFVDGISTRSGQVWFQKLKNDDGQIHVIFDQLKQGNKTTKEKIEYLFQNGLLIDRNYHKPSETRRQVIKPGEKMNLWKLGEGPFPLPMGQTKEEVRKLFEVTLVPAAGDADAITDALHLQLKPLPNTRYARSFGMIDIWVSQKNSFPVQIRTSAKDGSDVRTTRLQEVQVNAPGGLKLSDFMLENVDLSQWNVHSEPYRE